MSRPVRNIEKNSSPRSLRSGSYLGAIVLVYKSLGFKRPRRSKVSLWKVVSERRVECRLKVEGSLRVELAPLRVTSR
jgi:hypothetical protein